MVEPAGIHHRTRGPHRAAQKLREGLDHLLELLRRAKAAAAGDDDVGLGEIYALRARRPGFDELGAQVFVADRHVERGGAALAGSLEGGGGAGLHRGDDLIGVREQAGVELAVEDAPDVDQLPVFLLDAEAVADEAAVEARRDARRNVPAGRRVGDQDKLRRGGVHGGANRLRIAVDVVVRERLAVGHQDLAATPLREGLGLPGDAASQHQALDLTPARDLLGDAHHLVGGVANRVFLDLCNDENAAHRIVPSFSNYAYLRLAARASGAYSSGGIS